MLLLTDVEMFSDNLMRPNHSIDTGFVQQVCKEGNYLQFYL